MTSTASDTKPEADGEAKEAANRAEKRTTALIPSAPEKNACSYFPIECIECKSLIANHALKRRGVFCFVEIMYRLRPQRVGWLRCSSHEAPSLLFLLSYSFNALPQAKAL